MHPLYNFKLEQALERYQPFNATETHNLIERSQVLHTRALLVNQPRTCLNRKTFVPGHITGSMWVVNPDFSKTLMIEHPHSKVWMMPGGHADDDPYLLNVALREMEEETGVAEGDVKLWNGGSIFDVDTHYIPPRPVKDEPEHIHFDISYLCIHPDIDSLGPSPEGLAMEAMTLEKAETFSHHAGRRYRCVQKLRKLAAELT